MIDLCYGSVGSAYKSLPMPSFSASYHNSVFLGAVYKPSFKRFQLVETMLKCWSEDSISALQTCFQCTSWNVFFDTVEDINELTDLISSYVMFCMDSVVPTKKVIRYPNNKPWITKELKSIINEKKLTFFTGDPQERKMASRVVWSEVRKAKVKYREKM